MIAWVEFIGAVALITVVGWWFWDDVTEWLEYSHQRATLAELRSEERGAVSDQAHVIVEALTDEARSRV